MHLRLRHELVVGAALALLLVPACSGDDGGGDASPSSTPGTTSTSSTAATTTSPTTSTSVAAGTSTSTSTPSASTSTSPSTVLPAAPGACTARDGTAPAAGPTVGTGPIVDVDGDGRADEAWLAVAADGRREMGVETAAGGVVRTLVQSASPVQLTLLVANADDAGPVEFFVDDNRTVQLWAFAGCKLVTVTNPQGQPYLFDLGFRGTGTGVGCVATPAGRRLVGLRRDDPVAGDPPTLVRWTRTVIELDGTKASNGASTSGTFTRPADDAAIDLLSQVSCGDLTMADDGITPPSG